MGAWWNARTRGGRCAEARMLAADLDLQAAEERNLIPEPTLALIRRGFESPSSGEQIAAAVELRARLAETYSDERLEFLVHQLREQLATLRGSAGPHSARAVPAPPRAAVLAHALHLLDQLKLSYTFVSERDARVSQIRFWALSVLAGLFGVLLAVFVAWALIRTANTAFETRLAINSLLNYGLLVAVAASGAVVSIIQRSQAQAVANLSAGDPVAHISALRHGLSGLVVAGLAGPALALVLVPLFAGDMISLGDLTPEFRHYCKGARANFSLIDHCVSLDGAGSAKLLVWAFLAGFAERLVPDVLDRLVGRAGPGGSGKEA